MIRTDMYLKIGASILFTLTTFGGTSRFLVAQSHASPGGTGLVVLPGTADGLSDIRRMLGEAIDELRAHRRTESKPRVTRKPKPEIKPTKVKRRRFRATAKRRRFHEPIQQKEIAARNNAVQQKEVEPWPAKIPQLIPSKSVLNVPPSLSVSRPVYSGPYYRVVRYYGQEQVRRRRPICVSQHWRTNCVYRRNGNSVLIRRLPPCQGTWGRLKVNPRR